MSSSDSDAEEMSFLSKVQVEQKETNMVRKQFILAEGYRYVFSRESTEIVVTTFFKCQQKVKNSRGIYRNCKARGFMKLEKSLFFLTKLHNHDAKPNDYKVRQRLRKGYDVAKVLPITKTKSIVRSIKRGASRQLRATLPKEAFPGKFSVTSTRSDAWGVFASSAENSLDSAEDSQQFLLYDSRKEEPDHPWIMVWRSSFGHHVLQRAFLIAFDATYTKSPRGFSQFFTIHALLDGRFLPIAFVWMQNKAELTYGRVFREVFSLPPESYNIRLFLSAFMDYFRKIYLFRGTGLSLRPANYPIYTWNINKYVRAQLPVTNNSVESWNREYKAHFAGGGKPDRSKVIQFQIEEEEAVRHAIERHEDKPEEPFRRIRATQQRSEELLHALLVKWEEKSLNEICSNEDLVSFLRSVQETLWFAKDLHPDLDDIEESEAESSDE